MNEVGGRKKYATWRPSRFALILGIAETVIFRVGGREGMGWRWDGRWLDPGGDYGLVYECLRVGA